MGVQCRVMNPAKASGKAVGGWLQRQSDGNWQQTVASGGGGGSFLQCWSKAGSCFVDGGSRYQHWWRMSMAEGLQNWRWWQRSASLMVVGRMSYEGNGDPLLVELEDIVQQGILYCFWLADRTSQCRLLLGPEDLVQMINLINFTNPLQSPPQKIGSANMQQFRRGIPHQPTLRLQALSWGSNEAMLSACSIAQMHPPTTATGLDSARHHGWAWKWVVRRKWGRMCDVRQICDVPYFSLSWFLIPTLAWYKRKDLLVPHTEYRTWSI